MYQHLLWLYVKSEDAALRGLSALDARIRKRTLRNIHTNIARRRIMSGLGGNPVMLGHRASAALLGE